MGANAITLLGGRLRQLLRNRKVLGAASLTVADVASKAIAFAMVPFLANRMGAAGFGALNLYMSATEMLAFACFLGGPALLPTAYIRDGYTSARRLRSTTIRFSLWIVVVLLIASLAVSRCAPSAVPLAVGVLIVAVSYVQGLNSLELAYYRGAQHYSIAVAGQFSFAVLGVLLTVLAFEFASPTVTNRLLSIALAGGVIQLVYALELRRKYYEPADEGARRANTSLIVSFGLSLFVHVASQWARLSIDRFVLAGHAGLAAAGVYSVALAMAMVPALFFGSVSQQLQPYLFQRLNERNFSGFRRIQFGFICLALAFTALYYGLLLTFFNLMFSTEYYAAKALFPALIGASAAASVYHVFSHAAFYERRGIQISLLTGGAMVVHLTGLGALVVFNQVTPFRVALVFFISSVTAALGMAALSHRTIRQLAVHPS